MIRSLFLIAMMIFAIGCSTSPKTQVIQLGDEQLTKEQIHVEFSKLDAAQREIESKKGVTGTNVASALFWIPGLAYTYYDASDATRMIESRRSHLTSIYNKKYS
jgi:hypothetical protein